MSNPTIGEHKIEFFGSYFKCFLFSIFGATFEQLLRNVEQLVGSPPIGEQKLDFFDSYFKCSLERGGIGIFGFADFCLGFWVLALKNCRFLILVS